MKCPKIYGCKRIIEGIKIEKEHHKTIDFIKNYYNKNHKFPNKEEIYKSITLDHLKEDKNYYHKLKNMERNK